MVKVIVKKPNLRYRVRGYKQGRGFTPKVGSTISLEKEIAKKEIKTGNVRLPLEEEKEKMKKKKDLKKKSKE